MKYFFFLDETGDHGLDYVDDNFPLFLLCGCLVREDHLKAIEDKINALKQKYFKSEKVILHSRDIRKCEGSFQIFFDLHIKKYGKGAKDPYSLALSFVIERLIFCIDKTYRNAIIEILAEKRGRKEDLMLLSHFNSTMDRWTYYVSSERLKGKIVRFGFHAKKENIVGLQIADLCAYPLARSILNPGEPYIPFEIIRHKIYSNEKGEYEGWGLKVFP